MLMQVVNQTSYLYEYEYVLYIIILSHRPANNENVVC